MKNSHRFFANTDCMYYPCHEMPEDGDLNCLFCYCPLYALGEECGGIFTYSRGGEVKLCMDCHLPHTPDYYDVIIDKLSEDKGLCSQGEEYTPNRPQIRLFWGQCRSVRGVDGFSLLRF